MNYIGFYFSFCKKKLFSSEMVLKLNFIGLNRLESNIGVYYRNNTYATPQLYNKYTQ